MVKTPTVNYPRAPSRELLKLLMPGGFLAPLIDLHRRRLKGTELDVHFRIGDEIQVYCGLTRILTVKRLKRFRLLRKQTEPLKSLDGLLRIEADPKYIGQPCAKETGLFRRWRIGEYGLNEAIESYLNDVEVNPSFIKGEGAIQLQWSRVTWPWTPFDREAVLNYPSIERREETKKFPEVKAAFHRRLSLLKG